jgi:tRNA A37 threonylcarbamoyltransferase TsaD
VEIPWSELTRRIADTLYALAINEAIERPRQADPKQIRAFVAQRAKRLVGEVANNANLIVSELTANSVEQDLDPHQLRDAITGSIVFSPDNALMIARTAIGARQTRPGRSVPKAASPPSSRWPKLNGHFVY